MPYTYEYPRPAVTVDAAIFRDNGEGPQILLIQRGNPPFEGMWAIPGGFIDIEEPLEDAAKRELHEETGIHNVELHQYGVYGKPGRDPRHRTISIAYAGFLENNGMKAQASDDAADCRWFLIDELPDMAFDHNLLATDAISFAKTKHWF